MKYSVLPLALAAALLLPGCAQLSAPPQPVPVLETALDHFSISGRLSVKVDGRGHYSNFDWTRLNGRDEVAVNTPLGQTVAQLVRDEGGVCLMARGRTRCAPDTEALTEAELGWPLPLDNLGYWVAGVPAPGPVERNAEGFHQQGWTVKLADFQSTDSGPRPGRVVLIRDDRLEIRLAIHAWR